MPGLTNVFWFSVSPLGMSFNDSDLNDTVVEVMLMPVVSRSKKQTGLRRFNFM
jgi:hypothetical protein